MTMLACPLCLQPGFLSLITLRDCLISAATKQVMCPVCNETLLGLDKFTIHLFSHTPVCNVNTTTQTDLEYEEQVLQVESTKHVSTLFSFNNISMPDLSSTTQVSASHQHRYEVHNGQQNTNINLAVDSLRSESPIQNITEKSFQNERIEKVNSHQTNTFLYCLARDSKNISVRIDLDNKDKISESDEQCATDNGSKSPDTEKCSLAANRDIQDMTLANLTMTHNTAVLKCVHCGFGFSDSSILAMHQQLVHPKDGNKIQSEDSIHGDRTRQFPCHLCPKGFKMRGSLMVHMRVAHGGLSLGETRDPLLILGKAIAKIQESEVLKEERKFVCTTCNKAFKKEQHLSQHLRTHDGKQWACEVCNKLFTTKYFLKKHKRLHTGEMPYTCPTCQKTFTFQQSYHKHLLYHSDDKPHVCTECERAFKELSTLHNHQRIHTGEKPFTCKCFRQRVSYLVHRRIHTGVMPYKCTACGKSFRYKVSQRTHKCPSQPPGTVVRQSGDLLQKLLNYKTQAGLEEIRAQKEWMAEPSASKFTILMGAEIQNTPPSPKSFPVSHTQAIKPPEMAPISHEQSLYHVSPLGDHSILTIVSGDGPPREGEEGPVGDTETAETETTDFFNLVMSPPLPSPSERLKHLSLSTDERIYQYVFDNNDGHDVPCQEEASTPNTQEQLQTINEESLKQLLLFGSLT